MKNINLLLGQKELSAGGRRSAQEIKQAAERALAVTATVELVIVTDSGCGMDAASQAHLFEPLFTTKWSGQGAGLRLANVYGVVRQNHGAIRVSNEIGQGTSVTIDLPSATEPNEQAEECGLQQAAPCGTETVFVVDDERVVRTITHLPQGYRDLETPRRIRSDPLSGRCGQGRGNHDS